MNLSPLFEHAGEKAATNKFTFMDVIWFYIKIIIIPLLNRKKLFWSASSKLVKRLLHITHDDYGVFISKSAKSTSKSIGKIWIGQQMLNHCNAPVFEQSKKIPKVIQATTGDICVRYTLTFH